MNEHILFVDDEAMIVKLGSTVFQKLGYRLTGLTSGAEALEMFNSQPDLFDLIITDQSMPGLTGKNLSRRILEVRPDIPIILCSGHSDIISEDEALQIGIKRCLSKPIGMSELAEIVRTILDS